ncbi:MAG: Maf family nucleotide pyrophosphatase [Bacteroidota bacterium]
MKPPVLNIPIVLASKSPRRKQLLEEAGFTFRIQALDVDESFPETLAKREVAAYLAEKKARASKHFLQSGEVMLTADSVVLLDGKIYEKPKDRADAIRILEALADNKHQVVTGVCLLNAEKHRTFSGVSDVSLEPLSRAEIEYYVDHYQPYDKAGSYAIQEWIGHCKIARIEGLYTNIMGLPVQLVYQHLEYFL